MNTVAIRVQTDGVSTMEELCAEVTERCLRAFQHQQYPFDQVIQDINPERGENNNPIFQRCSAINRMRCATTSSVSVSNTSCADKHQ